MQKIGSAISYILLLVLVAVLVGGFVFRQDLYDEYRLRQYEPSAEVESYVARTGMSALGEKIFYTGHPQVNEPEEFNQNCQFAELSIVLGCYTTPDIFILNVEDKRLNGIEDVTAAHEMLHIVYERLSSAEKEDVDAMLQRQFEQLDNERVLDTLATYSATSTYNGAPAYNEMHSIFATELADISDELEEYFKQYFDDRQKVADLSIAYEKVFTDLQDTIDDLKSQIQTLSDDISGLESDLDSRRSELNGLSNQLNSLQSSGNIAEYNELVAPYNNKVAQFNSILEDYRQKIDSHNSLVKEVNGIVLEKRSLQKSLDSKFSEESASQ